MRVKNYTNREDEVVFILLDYAGKPLWWPNLYATMNFRNTGHSPNTVRNMLHAIRTCYSWAKAQRIDFDSLLLKGNFLNDIQAEALRNELQLTWKSHYENTNTANKPPGNSGKILSFERARKANKLDDNIYVSRAVHATRLRYVVAYLRWMLARRRSLESRKIKAADFDVEAAEVVINQIAAAIPRVSAGGDDESLEGLDPDLVTRITQHIHPESNTNPWKSKFVRARNYLMWLMFIDTGARRNELKNVRVDDVTYATRTVTLRISKTVARSVPIRQYTSDEFDRFVRLQWGKLPRSARRSGYLFTGLSGSWISSRRINAIFENIRNSLEDCPPWVSPHSVRRTWNDRFSRAIDGQLANGVDYPEQKEQQIRNRLMGWSPNSKTAERYLRRHTRERADEIVEKMFSDPTEKQRPL